MRKLVVALFCLTACWVSGCAARQPMTIVYIVPDGFRGVFEIRPRQANGVHLVQGADGKWLIHVPKARVLLLQGDGPWTDWHEIEARFASGQRIEVVNEPRTSPENQLGFWFLPGGKAAVSTYNRYFVGTKAEARRSGEFET